MNNKKGIIPDNQKNYSCTNCRSEDIIKKGKRPNAKIPDKLTI